MAIRTVEQAFEALSEKIKGIEKRLEQISNQRRMQVVDIFGSEVTGTSLTDKRSAKYYISISPDMCYLERFQFKVFVMNSDNAEDFRVYIKNAGEEESKEIEITKYLVEQAEKIGGDYIGSAEKIYPKIAFGIDDEGRETDNLNGSFDLIYIANSIYNEETDDESRLDLAEKIVSAGMKRIRITATEEFSATILLYLKYSHLNR